MRLFTIVGILLVVVLPLSGCLSIGPDSPTTASPGTTTTTVATSMTNTDATADSTTNPGSDAGGKLFTYRVDQPPDDATIIDSTDASVENSTFVQELLRRTADNGNVTANINGSQLDRLDRELEDVPYTSGGKSGHYLRYDGLVIRIVIARYQ